MSEIDLVPSDYRTLVRLRAWLKRFAWTYAVLLVSVGVARAGVAYGVQTRHRELERLEAARETERAQRAELDGLRRERTLSARRLEILEGLRGGVAAVEMFAAVDRAIDERVWFVRWTFARAGELVDNDPEQPRTGYFIVLPLDKREEREKGWLMQTHMEIRAQAIDHSALASFVRRLVEQPEIEEARVLETRTRRLADADVVDFELAVVVRTRA